MCQKTEFLDVSALLSGQQSSDWARLFLKAAALRGIKVRIIKRDIRLDGIDLLADELSRTDLLAASDGQFDGFHSGFRVPLSVVPGFVRVATSEGPSAYAWTSVKQSCTTARSGKGDFARHAIGSYGTCNPVWGEEAGTAMHCDTPESSGSGLYPSAWLLPALADIVTEPDVKCATHKHLLLWPSSLAGAALDRFSPGLETLEKKCCCKVPHVP